MKQQAQLALGVAAGVALVAGGVWLFSPEPELRPVPDFALLGSVGRGGQNLPADDHHVHFEITAPQGHAA